MEHILIEKKDHPKEFFAELFRIWNEEYQQENKTLPALVVNLNKKQNIDFCQLAVDAMNDNFRCFDAIHIFEDTLSDMNLNLDSVLRLAESLFDRVQGDMVAYRQFKPFEDLITKQPEFARELLAELINQDKPYIVGYISRLYQGFSKENEHQIHKELCDLKGHKSRYVLMAIADVLGELDYDPSKNKKLLKQTLSVFDDLENKNIEEINRILVFAYANLLKHTDKAKSKLISFSKSDKILLQGAITQVLFRLQDNHGNDEWFSKALVNLSNVSCEYTGIIRDIDFVLEGLIKKNNNWALAESFFVEWLLRSDYTSSDQKLSKLFGSTLVAFVNQKDLFSQLLTKFFNHDNFKIHNAAAEITSYCQLHKVNDLKLDRAILKQLSYDDCLFICRKILGYVIAPEYLCSLCFSVLDAFPRNKDIQSLIYSIFSSHIGENHPGRTIDFLKMVLSETKSINKQNLASQVIEDIETYHAYMDELPRLKELAPARQKSLKIFRESAKKMEAAMVDAQKDSIVSMIATKIIMKQGTGSFHFMGGAYSEISKMGKFSEQIEIPHSEVTHPVDAALERMNFRLAKRGD